MKKAFALLLAFAMLFAVALTFAACGEDSADASSTGATSSTPSAATSSGGTSSEEPASEDTSTEEPVSGDTSDEPGDEPPAFISNFLSFGTVNTTVNATSDNSVRLTGIDTGLVSGAIVLYTPDCEELPDADALTDFAVAVFDYSQDVFGYVKTAFYAVGDADDLEVPDDGFAVAIHSTQDTYIKRLNDLDDTTTVFPHGLHLSALDYDVKKASAAPTIDGTFDESEWGAYLIDEIDATNDLWSYAQFEKDNYYSTASYYVTYDDTYLYLCVVVNSPYHFCPVTQSNANSMWQYECIQVKVSSEAPDEEYILTNFDHVANAKAVNDGVLRSYGFAANDSNETCYYETGITSTFTGLAGCSRDDAAQQTVYEVAFPWAEFEITPEAGMRLGLTFSINSTNAEDFENKIFKNLTYRCGGGVIGRNDWSKSPVITLK